MLTSRVERRIMGTQRGQVGHMGQTLRNRYILRVEAGPHSRYICLHLTSFGFILSCSGPAPHTHKTGVSCDLWLGLSSVQTQLTRESLPRVVRIPRLKVLYPSSRESYLQTSES